MDELEQFAADRGARLKDVDKELRPLVKKALIADDKTGWGDITDAAAVLWLEMFESAAPKAYQEAALSKFRKDLRHALAQTGKPDDPPSDAQVDRVTSFISTYATNNATYQGAFASGQRRKQWATRGDGDVRKIHAAINGQQVPIGGTFEVNGSKLHYPGEPVGPPENWINCRCLVRGTGKKVGMALTAAAEGVDTSKTAVVVALPSADHPVNGISSEEDGAHMTLASLGDPETFDLDAVKAHVATVAADQKPFADKVIGRGTLGPNKADVHLMNGEGSVPMRDELLNGAMPDASPNPTRMAHDAVEQYPNFTPHVTLGYPETPANGEPDFAEITFDRLAIWAGNDDHTEYPLGASMTAAAMAPPMDDVETPAEDAAPDEEMEPDLVDEPVEVPFHGVAAPVGVMSGDGRMFADGGVTWRNLPVPLLYVRSSTEGHSGAVVVGRIDKFWVDEGNLVQYNGVFNSMPEVQEVIMGLADGSFRGVSVDIDQATIDQGETSDDIESFMDGTSVTVFKTARIAGLTIVAIPAFQEAYIALGECDCPPEELDPTEPHDETVDDGTADQEDDEDPLDIVAAASFAPGTHDGPGWITNPKSTQRIRTYWTHGEGAAKIKWGLPGDFNRCRKQLAKYVENPDWLAGLCANMHHEALGVWPGQEDGKRAALIAAGGVMSPAVTLVASAVNPELPGEFFENPHLTVPTQLTITDEGHVYGHLATWGTCHIGMQGVCTTPPISASNYAYFHTGRVETSLGEVSVGHFTRGIGHAGPRVGMASATAHYDKTDSIWADVAIGEDGVGIWFAGALRDGLPDSTVRELKASGALSGDWRAPNNHGGLELIAAVSVGTPGFPIPRTSLAASGTEQISLVASGIVTHEAAEHLQLQLAAVSDPGLVRAVADEIEYRHARRERLAVVREQERTTLRPLRIAEAKKGSK